MALLPSTEYESIRELLGLTATDLPNAVIQRLPFLPAAEAEVKAAIPTYQAHITAGGDERLHVLSAIVYLTAAKLCARQRNASRESERIGDLTLGRIDWDALERTLRAELGSHLQAVATAAADSGSGSALAPSSLVVGGVTRYAKQQVAATGDSDFRNI